MQLLCLCSQPSLRLYAESLVHLLDLSPTQTVRLNGLQLQGLTTMALPTSSADKHGGDTAPLSLIVYPSQFPIKVLGLRADGLVHAISAIAKAFDTTFDAATIELRESKGGNYLGVTITVMATSREQLDELYSTLSTHPMVKVVL